MADPKKKTPDDELAAIAGQDDSGAAVPPLGRDEHVDAGDGIVKTEVQGDELVADDAPVEAPSHPEPVSLGLVQQDNVTTPGVETTRSPGVVEDGEFDMASSHHHTNKVVVDDDKDGADVTPTAAG